MNASEVYDAIQALRSGVSDKVMGSLEALPQIAMILGPIRTAMELIPYVAETLTFSEAQWVVALGKIAKIDMGAFDENVFRRTLEACVSICGFDSSEIRSAAISAIVIIVRRVPTGKCHTILEGVLNRMLNGTHGMAASAACIFGETIDIFTEKEKSNIIAVLLKLRTHPSVSVRRALVTACTSIARVSKGEFSKDMIDAMLSLANDYASAVSLDVSDFLVAYIGAGGDVKTAKEIGKGLLEHQRWRVRCKYVQNIDKIYTDAETVHAIIKEASDDAEDEVKTAAAEQMRYYVSIDGVDHAKAEEIVSDLLSSRSWYVRASLAKALPYFTESMTREFVASKLLEMMADESQNVKITAIEALTSDQIPVETVVECAEAVAASKEWRERKALVHLATRACIMPGGTADIVKKVMFDDAYEVRKAILDELPSVLAGLSEELLDDIGATVEEKSKDNDYQVRQSAVSAAAMLASVGRPIGKSVLAGATSDPVANVRFVVAKRTPRNADFSDILSILGQDPDADVRDAAAEM